MAPARGVRPVCPSGSFGNCSKLFRSTIITGARRKWRAASVFLYRRRAAPLAYRPEELIGQVVSIHPSRRSPGRFREIISSGCSGAEQNAAPPNFASQTSMAPWCDTWPRSERTCCTSPGLAGLIVIRREPGQPSRSTAEMARGNPNSKFRQLHR